MGVQSVAPDRLLKVTSEIGEIGFIICHGTEANAKTIELQCPGATCALSTPEDDVFKQSITFKGMQIVSKADLGALGIARQCESRTIRVK